MPDNPRKDSLVEQLANHIHVDAGIDEGNAMVVAMSLEPFITTHTEEAVAVAVEECAEIVNKCYEKRHTMFKDDMLALIIREIRSSTPNHAEVIKSIEDRIIERCAVTACRYCKHPETYSPEDELGWHCGLTDAPSHQGYQCESIEVRALLAGKDGG